MISKLEGKTVLVTGASSGLGRGMATALAARGNDLVVTARRVERLESLAREVEAMGRRCVVVPADAIDTAACQAVIDAGLEAYGHIDVAILNAGGGKATDMATASVDDVLHMMRVNYDTMVNFLVPMIAHMRSRDGGKGAGTIAYTCSPSGYLGLPKSGPYSAAKAAGRVLLDATRIELAHTPIRLVALYPGFTRTEGLDPDDVPVKSLIISKDRAVREMLRAIERGTSHHIFPKRIKLLIWLARALPEPLRRRLLGIGLEPPA